MATALLEEQEYEQSGVVESSDDPFSRLWTVEEFYCAYDDGEFGYSKRWELVQGRITEKMPPGPRHAYLADAIAHMLRVSLEPPLLVREEKSARLSDDTELVPDVSVVSGVRADYLDHHPAPGEVAVLVEVADTTAVKDLGEKALLYAQSGIADYWVVLANDAVIVRHRQPLADGYQEVTRLTGPDTLSPLALPEIVWTINELLGRTEASEEN